MNNYAVCVFVFCFFQNFQSQFKLQMHLNNMWIPRTGIYLLLQRERLHSKKLWHQPGRKTNLRLNYISQMYAWHDEILADLAFFIKKSAEEVWFGLSLSSELIKSLFPPQNQIQVNQKLFEAYTLSIWSRGMMGMQLSLKMYLPNCLHFHNTAKKAAPRIISA